LKKRSEAQRAELEALEQQFLAPSAADLEIFANLLRQPNTGLIRLLPREKYESDSTQTNKKTLTMRGGGAYYYKERIPLEINKTYLVRSIDFETSDVLVAFSRRATGCRRQHHNCLETTSKIPGSHACPNQDRSRKHLSD